MRDAHALRNKLANIRNAAHVVKRRLVAAGLGGADPKLAELLGVIEDEALQAMSLVDPTEVPAPRPAAVRSPAQTASGRLLLVDDDLAGRQILASLLGDAGLDVACAGSLAEAAAALADGAPYDLVIVDLYLPDGRGTELLARLREHHPSLRVVLLSGTVLYDEGVPPGFDAYLPKLLDFEETLAAIQDLLAESRA